MQTTQPRTVERRWDGRTRGGVWLFAICVWLLPRVGVPGAWVGSYLIATGFLLCGGRHQYGSLGYWRRMRPRAGPLVHWMLAWRHFASFGRVLCDRMLVYLHPDRFRFEFRNGATLERAVRSREGCILLAAHVGNWELSGWRLKELIDGAVHLVMVRNDDAYVQRFVDQRMRGEGVSVIDPRDPLGASLAIHAALRKGDTVCMLGDRLFGTQPQARVPFLGGSARFPLGPFHVAAITGVPILVVFLVKLGPRRYRLEVDPPWRIALPPRGPARRAALERIAAQWAHRLERQVRRFPMQWHNFYDFWA